MVNWREYEIHGRIEGIGDFAVRHLERGRNRIFITVPKEEPSASLRFGEKYKVEINSVRERRDFRVENFQEAGPTVKISRASVESWGLPSKLQGEKMVLDLRFKNMSLRNQAAKRVFAVFDTKKEELKLRVRRIGGRTGDVLRLEEKNKYTIAVFLRDFETYKDEGLGNVALRMGNEGLLMIVDGRNFPLCAPRLRAFGLQAILSSRIGRDGAPIRFTFDGERARIKLFDDSPVTVARSEHGLAISYDRGRASRTFRVLDVFERKVLENRIMLVSVPENEQGKFRFGADAWLRAHVRDRFARCNRDIFLRQKGDVSEEICRYALALTKFWDEIADHPHNTSSAEGSRRTGPDSLQRLSRSDELFYFEFKWWSGQEASPLGSARRQAEDYIKRFPTYHGEKVAGVFTGLLDWNVKSEEVAFHVKRMI